MQYYATSYSRPSYDCLGWPQIIPPLQVVPLRGKMGGIHDTGNEPTPRLLGGVLSGLGGETWARQAALYVDRWVDRKSGDQPVGTLQVHSKCCTSDVEDSRRVETSAGAHAISEVKIKMWETPSPGYWMEKPQTDPSAGVNALISLPLCRDLPTRTDNRFPAQSHLSAFRAHLEQRTRHLPASEAEREWRLGNCRCVLA